MKTSVSLEVLTEDEVEEIAIQTYALLQSGWTKADWNTFFADSELQKLASTYVLSPIESRKWFRNDAKHFVFLEKRYGDSSSVSVETRFFSREEAYEYEMNEKSKPNDLL